MNAYIRYRNRLEKYLQTERGKRFINYAYSFGAAIVILGAMFKLLHFPFGNEMLFIGMVTECVVFILSAFDTPVRDYRWEEVFPSLSSDGPGESSATARLAADNPFSMPHTPGKSPSAASQTAGMMETQMETEMPHGLSAQTESYDRQMEALNRTLAGLNSVYELQLKSVNAQLGDIEQINRGLNRLRAIYGDDMPEGKLIKTETEKMAAQMKELNDLYGRMLQAMTAGRRNDPYHPND